jgi:hypothetical protein
VAIFCKDGNENSDSEWGGQHLNDRCSFPFREDKKSLVRRNSMLEQLHTMRTKRRYAYTNRS